MLNVIIIDDESFVVKSLLNAISWDALNLHVTSTFSNGVDALEFIENNPVDIVMTDIRMPGFTGLDLCSHIHTSYPHIQMIIMSGYADFSYAQKAINYNVLGYCVKPLDFNELTLLLRKATSHIMKIHTPSYDIIDAIENEEYQLIDAYLLEHHLNPSEFFMMISIGQEPFTPYIFCNKVVIKFGPQKFLYLLSQSFQSHRLSTSLLTSLKIKGVGIYPDPVHSETLKSSLHQTMMMATQYFFLGAPCVNIALLETSSSALLSKLQSALSSNNLGAVNLIIAELLDSPTLNKHTISFALKLCNLFITHHTIHYQLETEDLYVYSIDQLLSSYNSFSDMLSSLYQMICVELPIDTATHSYNNNFIHLLRFINQNYMHDITIGDVSERLNLSPNYISQLFKKETGSTYTKYLTQLRMDKAKQLLLQADLSLSDICEQIGYNDYFYFLKIFKKHEGTSPGKYRSQLGIPS